MPGGALLHLRGRLRPGLWVARRRADQVGDGLRQRRMRRLREAHRRPEERADDGEETGVGGTHHAAIPAARRAAICWDTSAPSRAASGGAPGSFAAMGMATSNARSIHAGAVTGERVEYLSL